MLRTPCLELTSGNYEPSPKPLCEFAYEEKRLVASMRLSPAFTGDNLLSGRDALLSGTLLSGSPSGAKVPHDHNHRRAKWYPCREILQIHGPSTRALLSHELLAMRNRDQRARDNLTVKSAFQQPITPEDVCQWERVDAENTARMKEIIAQYGWPGRSLVGEDGATDAFLLVQHADHDTEFQKACLELLREAVGVGEAPPHHLAFLTDRICLAQQRPQVYGTQMVQEGGAYRFAEVENPEQVNARRAKVGLYPLSEY